jgi:archaellum component FlaG (FlaF/FlaG flagellin family)
MHIQFYSKKSLLFYFILFISVSSAIAQNVGIGTTKPLVPLHIRASDEALRIQGSYPWIGFTDNSADSITYDGFLYFPDTSMVLGSRIGTNMPIILAPNNTGVVYVTSASNVGIGIASPTQKLDVNSTVRIRGGSPVKGAVLTSDSIGDASWQLAPGSVLVDTVTETSSKWIHNSQYSLQTSPGSLLNISRGT